MKRFQYILFYLGLLGNVFTFVEASTHFRAMGYNENVFDYQSKKSWYELTHQHHVCSWSISPTLDSTPTQETKKANPREYKEDPAERERWIEKRRRNKEYIQKGCAEIDSHLHRLMKSIAEGASVAEVEKAVHSVCLLKGSLGIRVSDIPKANYLTFYNPLALAIKMGNLEMAEFLFAKARTDSDNDIDQHYSERYWTYGYYRYESRDELKKTRFTNETLAEFFVYSALTGNAAVFYFLLSCGAKIDCSIAGSTIAESIRFNPALSGECLNAMDCLIYGRRNRLGDANADYAYIEKILRERGVRPAVFHKSRCSVQ